MDCQRRINCTAELGHVHVTYFLLQDFWSNVIAAATYNTRIRPHARHASVSCLAWTSDDPSKHSVGLPILSAFTDGPCDSRMCVGVSRRATWSGFAPMRRASANLQGSRCTAPRDSCPVWSDEENSLEKDHSEVAATAWKTCTSHPLLVL